MQKKITRRGILECVPHVGQTLSHMLCNIVILASFFSHLKVGFCVAMVCNPNRRKNLKQNESGLIQMRLSGHNSMVKLVFLTTAPMCSEVTALCSIRPLCRCAWTVSAGRACLPRRSASAGPWARCSWRRGC